MTMSEMELLALLRELDDPERLERPLNYDRAAASLAFGGLARRLETDFGVQCEFEQDTQDSSEYGRVSRAGRGDRLRDADRGLREQIRLPRRGLRR
ncbi:hypothetical protein [Streptomyces globisporus]|uniref:hypothetical protein n=1 Tax=Streptomyces globisporus TaxID=1908 RepID=UPI0037BAEDB4